MNNWTRIIKPSMTLVIGDVDVQLEKVDGGVRSVTLTAKDGKRMKISGEYSAIQLLEPTKPKMVKKHHVVGTLFGVKVSEPFDSDYEANNRRDELLTAGAGAQVKVEELEVPEELF